jgi:hypothetical protein
MVRRRVWMIGGIVAIGAVVAVVVVVTSRGGRGGASKPSAAQYSELRAGMTQAVVKRLVGKADEKCWIYEVVGRSVDVCFAGGKLSAKPSAPSGYATSAHFASIRVGMTEKQVWSLIGRSERKCWLYGAAPHVDRICFSGGRLVSKQQA